MARKAPGGWVELWGWKSTKFMWLHEEVTKSANKQSIQFSVASSKAQQQDDNVIFHGNSSRFYFSFFIINSLNIKTHFTKIVVGDFQFWYTRKSRWLGIFNFHCILLLLQLNSVGHFEFSTTLGWLTSKPKCVTVMKHFKSISLFICLTARFFLYSTDLLIIELANNCLFKTNNRRNYFGTFILFFFSRPN